MRRSFNFSFNSLPSISLPFASAIQMREIQSLHFSPRPFPLFPSIQTKCNCDTWCFQLQFKQYYNVDECRGSSNKLKQPLKFVNEQTSQWSIATPVFCYMKNSNFMCTIQSMTIEIANQKESLTKFKVPTGSVRENVSSSFQTGFRQLLITFVFAVWRKVTIC